MELVSYKNTLGVTLVDRLANTGRKVLFKDAVNRCDYTMSWVERNMGKEHERNDEMGKLKAQTKTFSSATMSATNPTQPGLESRSGLRGERSEIS